MLAELDIVWSVAQSPRALTLTETAKPVMAAAMNNPVLFTEMGDLMGTISGLAFEEESPSVSGE